MKTKIAIIIVIGIVVLLLGLKAINTWAFVKQAETMFRYGHKYRTCHIESHSYHINCEEILK